MPTPLTLSKSRIEALSDGVFSIAMTLLVLKLEVPAVDHHASNADMLRQLLDEAPAFLSFAGTFLVSAAFWLLHHLTFHFVRYVSRTLCWINLIFLMFVSLLPFSAGMMGHLFIHPVSQYFYFGNLLALALLLNLHWHYARLRGMAAIDPADLHARGLTYRIAAFAVGFAAALAVSMWQPRLSPLAFLLTVAAGAIAERAFRTRALRRAQS